MAGIYIHIPYCRQACRYCDFHFVVSVWQKNELLPYILEEINVRKDYLNYEIIDTIYFGGGTPSVLEIIEIDEILENIFRNYPVAEDAEISFEANPEDINREYLADLRKSGVNRLSIGVQSFQDRDLEFMHRIHNASQAVTAIKNAQDTGFENLSIDLIYGIPNQEKDSWADNLKITFESGIQHFSAYHLTFEPGTIFDHWRKKGRISPIPEDESIKQFKLLVKEASIKGFEHYEISNFAKSGFRSRHNSSYWQQVNYSGIGPSAHSYNGVSRRWNFRNNRKYIDCMKSGEKYYESEELTQEDHYNEYIMTSLRTSEGVDLLKIMEKFGNEKSDFFKSRIGKFIESGQVEQAENRYKLSKEGIFISDHIIASVFI